MALAPLACGGNESEGEAEAGGQAVPHSVCAIRCTTEADCPASDCIREGCAYDCRSGDCTQGGVFSQYECVAVRGVYRCVDHCSSDADCFMGDCSAVDDAGESFCGPCTSDGDCGSGNGDSCDVRGGRCTCVEDSECMATEGLDHKCWTP